MSRVLLTLTLLSSLSATATTFRLPFSQAQCAWAGGCYVTAYFDLNRANGVVRDWACGTHTYDNHTGIDMGVGGFAGMNQGRDVLAAADGVVIGAHDGEFDQCTSGACGAANYVWIKHADGKVSLYYHLRKNTVAVSVGQAVTCGQKLAQVGSSGYSTGPHLHFQVNAVQGDPNSFDDPFAGVNANCGGTFSWWVSQGGYKSLPAYGCQPQPQPDVQVLSVSVSPASPVEGDEVTLSAVVKNTGAASTGAVVGVLFSVGGSALTFGTTAAMAASATATVTANAKWKPSAGTHVLEAFADDVDRFTETNEGNNKRTQSVVVAARPDLLVTGVTVDKAEPIEGDTLTLTAAVENNGGATDGSFDVDFKVGGVIVTTKTAPVLSADGKAFISATWVATRGEVELAVVADPANTVIESNETNNALSQSLRSLAVDADGDGARADIDCADDDAARNGSATERCNGLDDNCDGQLDEGLQCSAEELPNAQKDEAAQPPADSDLTVAEAEGRFGCTASGAAPMLWVAGLLVARGLRRQRA